MTMLDPPTYGPWHVWFAWHPVDTVTHGWKWMVTLDRRRIQKKLNLPGPVDQCWEYRPKEARP